jgi:hypothetical protein
MLWSDRSEEPAEEIRRAQRMLRRAGLMIGLLLPAVLLVVAWRP